ncbi:hypothetical protein PIROE2DRAFT_60218 [Piromyces sp. E2]|nr:hypothetical protein PIROE2DRAFT_60218 [Piromyces sp. E2]|eukprot:OUM65175.1 hypothetical protein PIROE2DRAFT_60218 [Piromyces sp. E2]
MYGEPFIFNDEYEYEDDNAYINSKINKIVNGYSGTKSQKKKLKALLIKYTEEKKEEEEEYEGNDYEKFEDEEVNIITLKTLSEKYPNFNWKLYLEEKYNQIGMKDSITDDTEIILFNEEYFDRLNSLLGEVNGETLSYYFEW